ncbi:MAG: hypothetical protein KDD09_25515 [Phaeodactylibacter sp.]|nr:hypothetical protein [Phaeodactylibacter sp.]
MVKKTNNIEFIFLCVLGLTILALFLLLAKLIIDTGYFVNDHTDPSTGAEWASVVLIMLLLSIVYATIFFIWQFRLWRTCSMSAGRKPIQLTIIFLFGIFPIINQLADLFLRTVMGIEHPITEYVTKVFISILIFPLTGGK